MDFIDKNKKRLQRVIYGRTLVVILLCLLQVLAVVMAVFLFQDYITYFYIGFTVLSITVIINIVNDRTNSTFKLSWVIPVAVIPIFGTLMYLFSHFQNETKRIERRYEKLGSEIAPYMVQDGAVMDHLMLDSKLVASTARYVVEYGCYPIFENSTVKYFPLGEDKYEELKLQLEKAEKFIFLEYFIIDHGLMWDTILEILIRKAKEGVEVRLMYDGMCTLALLPYHYPKYMQKAGLKCKMFSPIKPVLSTHQNNRDHRKILVIDGKVAFTGGVNLADEYINKKVRFGHWKDTSVMVQGDAVNSFTMMFLQMWNISEKTEEDYKQYIVENTDIKGEYGYVMPYADTPLDMENTGENVYLDILNQSTDYVHIMTPYLILDNELIGSLMHTAKRGVEVIILLPHITDKPYAFYIAKTYYAELIEAGVQIYEYTPGFVHAKVFVSDNDKATVGTINLDCRSLYLNFECGTYFYKNSAVVDVEKDFQETLLKSHYVTLEDVRKRPIREKILGRIMRLFAPLF